MNAATENAFRQLHAIIAQHEPLNDSLLGGSLGLCTYYYTLYKVFGNEEYAEKALDLVEQAAVLPDEAARTLFGATFSSGGAGLCYVITTLYREGLLDMDLTEDLYELDEYLYHTAMDMIEREGNMDYLHGAAGIIHYFTHRLPDEAIQEKLTVLVKAFVDKKHILPGGTWFSSFVNETDDRSEINFSLSHGQTGFLLVLMNAYRKGISLPEIPQLVKSGVELLLSFRLHPEPGSPVITLFPSTLKSKNHEEYLASNRLAWCYGDLDILLLLYEAAAFLNKPEWKTMADELAPVTVARKSAKDTAITDTHFCHGTAGMVTTYNRLFELSGNALYKEAAAYWLNETLSLLPQELEKNQYKEKETALLEGLTGINLVLVTELSGKEQEWSRMLLV